ncbi:MAG: hypothetical protein NWF05_05310 [Candidatus Bathyarchaeota archaeon]|nr:hypothetical protein [Candidatus Bathyarchaeota archaeon]
MTVFSECGVSNKAVNDIRRKGFFVPKNHERFPRALRSIGFPELVYAWADSFTPPLTKLESSRYIDRPSAFYYDAIKSVLYLRQISKLLLKVLDNIESLGDLEAVAACLAILRVYYAAFDYELYKYDRHFEFYEYPESPVGYYYISLKALCFEASKSNKENDEWARQKFLSLLNCPAKPSLSSQYQTVLHNLHEEIVARNLANASTDGSRLRKLIEVTDPTLYKEIDRRAKNYYKQPDDLLKDCLRAKGQSQLVLRSKEIAKTDFLTIQKLLTTQQKRELGKCVNALGWFYKAQEEIAFVMGSKVGKHNLRDAEFKTFEYLKEGLTTKPEIIKESQRDAALAIFNYSGLEAFVAPRIFVYNAENKQYFTQEVSDLYFEELERWFPRA